jgi:hypothetical protein
MARRLNHPKGPAAAGPEPLGEADDLRTVELAWLQRHEAELARLYPGQWIALDGDRLVAHADDLPGLLALARQAGHPHPFITAVPREPILSLHA